MLSIGLAVLVYTLPPGSRAAAPARCGAPLALTPVAPELVVVEKDADAVAAEVWARVDAAAEAAIAEHGHFALAIPGGSILKMLAGTTPSWASKTSLAYVNHKCVPMDDAELATHSKASVLFLDGWEGLEAVVLGGSGDAQAEAASYEAQLRALPPSKLPRDASGLPVFDMMLIGVGDDGHVGSLYPERPEVLAADGWVLPVEMKVPGSITLSLPVMAGAKEVLIAACGVSDKYPKGKSAAMARGIEGEGESTTSFPAVGLRGVATWILDGAAAGELGFDYAESFRWGGASQKANVFI